MLRDFSLVEISTTTKEDLIREQSRKRLENSRKETVRLEVCTVKNYDISKSNCNPYGLKLISYIFTQELIC